MIASRVRASAAVAAISAFLLLVWAGNGMGVFLLAVAADDGGLDVPHLERAAGREQPFAKGRRVGRIVTVEQRLWIGDDYCRGDTEEIANALADIGVADAALGGHQPLVHDAGDARGQGGEALVGGVKGLEALLEVDGYSHHGRQQPDDQLVVNLRRVHAGVEKNEHAEQAIALTADRTGEAGAEAGGDGTLAQLRRRGDR